MNLEHLRKNHYLGHKMLIRRCKTDDFPSVKVLLEKFHKEAVEEYGLKCDRGLLELAIQKHYKYATVLVVGDEVVGLIAGQIVDYPLQKEKIFQEMVWYVTKEHREHGLKLLKAIEDQCKKEGIRAVIMVAMGNSMKEKLDRIYKFMGYKELETQYIKVVE